MLRIAQSAFRSTRACAAPTGASMRSATSRWSTAPAAFSSPNTPAIPPGPSAATRRLPIPPWVITRHSPAHLQQAHLCDRRRRGGRRPRRLSVHPPRRLSRRDRRPQRAVQAAGPGRLPGPAAGYLPDPEIAHVGLTETEARERHGDKVRALTWAFAENDRAQAERATEGLVKVVAGARGRVFGASIAGRHAGDPLQPRVLAAIGRGALRA